MSAHSNGTTFEWKATSGGTYAALVNEVVSISPQPGTVTKSPRGHLNATNRLHTTEPGARTPGMITVQCRCPTGTDANWDDLQLVKAWFLSGAVIFFKIKYPKAATDTVNPCAEFTGYLASDVVLTSPEDGPMEFSLEIELTSEITLTDGSAP